MARWHDVRYGSGNASDVHAAANTIPILLVDVLNPVLFAILVFAAGSTRPVANSSAILIGHTLAYFVAGVAVSLSIEQVAERLANPHPVDFMLSAIVGVGLLWLVVRTKKSGVPFALPYFAIVDQILKANLSTAESLVILAIYNSCYALPFIVVPAAVAVSGDSARPLLEKINGFLARASDSVMPWMFGLLALTAINSATSVASERERTRGWVTWMSRKQLARQLFLAFGVEIFQKNHCSPVFFRLL